MKRKAKTEQVKVKVVAAAPATLNARVYELEEQVRKQDACISELAKTIVDLSRLTQAGLQKLERSTAELKRQVSA